MEGICRVTMLCGKSDGYRDWVLRAMLVLRGVGANVLYDAGVIGGLAVASFSKTLAMVFGLGVFVVQVRTPCQAFLPRHAVDSIRSG